MSKMDCSFCSKNITEATGTMFVRKSGKVSYFCSSKCESNMVKLKRNPRKKKWAHEKAVKKEKTEETVKKEVEKKEKEIKKETGKKEVKSKKK